MRFHIALRALVCFAAFPTSAPAQNAAPPPSQIVVQNFLKAFNEHDVASMLSLVTDDVELFYSDDGGNFSLASSSSTELGDDMTRYFADRPGVQSFAESYLAGPVFVAFREQIVGGQSSIAVYEIRNDLIRRAWYFPAEDAPPPE